MVLAAASQDAALAFIELGAIALGLAVLARVSDRIGVSPIPAYLVAGLLFGEGGIAKPELSSRFLPIAAQIGVVLLLLTLGLEYTADELRDGLRRSARPGSVDLVLNAVPGAAAAFLLGWGPEEALLLAGITYISSSGVISKVLDDLGRLGNRETPAILSVLVLEDLAMTVYLPIVAVVVAGDALGEAALSIAIALTATSVALLAALRFGHHFTRVMSARSDEALLLGVFGVTLLVAGVAEQLDVSAAIGAFLVGVALSGPVQHRASQLIEPLRDLFAALFFVLFGLRVDVAELPPVLLAAFLLAMVTAATKVATGWFAAREVGVGSRARARAGASLIARGEFSIVIAGLAIGSTLDQDLVPLAAAYVLLLAIAGPILTRFADRLVPRGWRHRPPPGSVPRAGRSPDGQ
ncbi:MAG TPA: cation:proton antiporter [Acidimicrobiia bacterium]